MKPGDRVEVRAVWADTAGRCGVVGRVKDHGWGDEHRTVWVRLDDGDALPYAPEELRLIEGEKT